MIKEYPNGGLLSLTPTECSGQDLSPTQSSKTHFDVLKYNSPTFSKTMVHLGSSSNKLEINFTLRALLNNCH